MSAPLGSINSESGVQDESKIIVNNTDKTKDSKESILLKKAVFMVSVSGLAMLGGFGMTLARAKRRHPGSFSKGMVPDPQVELYESGASLGMRALGWGTIFAITGVGSLTFLICKAMGVHNVEEFKVKFQSVTPRIRRNETEPERVIIERFKAEILKDEKTAPDE